VVVGGDWRRRGRGMKRAKRRMLRSDSAGAGRGGGGGVIHLCIWRPMSEGPLQISSGHRLKMGSGYDRRARAVKCQNTDSMTGVYWKPRLCLKLRIPISLVVPGSNTPPTKSQIVATGGTVLHLHLIASRFPIETTSLASSMAETHTGITTTCYSPSHDPCFVLHFLLHSRSQKTPSVR